LIGEELEENLKTPRANWANARERIGIPVKSSANNSSPEIDIREFIADSRKHLLLKGLILSLF
jgi:hypothetical protein